MENVSNSESNKDQDGLKSLIESLLFVSNKPLKSKEFEKYTNFSETQILTALKELKKDKANSGIILLESPDGYQLATNSANSSTIKNFLNAELREKLTDATVEVLAIIAYRQPISKAEIEAIRGVNSQYSIRNLLMRGLIEKIPNPNDARSILYQTTTELLQHLGLSSVLDLPEFSELVSKIKLPETPVLNETNPPEEKNTLEVEKITEIISTIDPDTAEETSETKIAELDINSIENNSLPPPDKNTAS